MKAHGPSRRVLRFAEFFAGVGLVRVALEELGWLCVFANDVDQDKAQLYRRNFPGNHLVVADIRELTAASLPSRVDLATACFPCIDLSLAGNRAGLKGRHSGVFWAFHRILKERVEAHLPIPLLLIENVQGFLNSRGGADLRDTVRELNELGYLVDLVLVDAAAFVPQSRPRVFLIAEHTSSSFKVTSPRRDLYCMPNVLQPQKVTDFIAAHPELKWAAIDFPPLPERAISLADVVERVDYRSTLWWPEHRVAKLLQSMRPVHRKRIEWLKQTTRGGIGTIYRRTREGRSVAEIRVDGLAGCLRTPRGGSSKQFLLTARNGRIRVRDMTPREYARLQGAPESFKLGANTNKALFAFGDAVCVPVVRWLGDHGFAHR